MPDVLLCAGCGKGLRPGQVGTWREFTALESVGGGGRVRAKRYTGRVLCAECALPPSTGQLWDDGPGLDGPAGPMASKTLVGASR